MKMKKINTVLGTMDVSELGVVLPHEHFLMAEINLRFAFPDWIDMQAIEDCCVESLSKAKKYGLNTVIDATPINLGRDIVLLQNISRRTGIHIIAATGFYFTEMPWFRTKNCDLDSLTEILVKEAETGMQGTGARPGIIKCATDADGVTPMNEMFLRAAARASLKTGLKLMTHACVKNRSGLRQQEIFREEGVDLGNVIVGHCDDGDDWEYTKAVLENGSYVGMDRLGVEHIRPLAGRIDMLERTIKEGYGDRVFMSHDCNVWSDYGRAGGVRRMHDQDPDWNYCTIFEKVIPELLRRGVKEDEILRIMTTNVGTFLS